MNKRLKGQKIGVIRGSAKLTIQLEPQPVEYDPSADPADVYANFVRAEIRSLMEMHHCLPSEVTVGLEYDEE